ncbi:carbohydrate ABC transporter permease [Brachybacterium phenoliresistens]|uniref:Sugar ABC transporter permease n=1 Tax=Brachybacterium phenoliresistens TaxID=396014 RepID=Z9JQ28_9MICO|nr:carbohydrate ABC transporter permease [Brachybacterium phenoliresistens]EWS80108.1 sugar ABC transporter permease [Brachybacterium phenoliresistens]
MRESRSYRTFTVLNTIFLLGVVFLTMYPFLNIIAQSLSSEAAIMAGRVTLFPIGFTTETYEVVMSDRLFWVNYKNTVVYTVVATAISLVLTTMYAYAISRMRLRGRGLFIGIAVFTMFFNGGLIPNYILINSLNMDNSIWAIVIPNAVSIFNLLVMKAFFENLPLELEEAAAIDGLTTYGILLRIVIPLSKAILATMLLFYAVSHWNSWFQAFIYLSDKELFPVTMYLRNMIAGTSQTSDVAAASADAQNNVSSNIKAVTMVLTVLPILCVYPFIQRYFVSGVMLGSVKQ